MSKRSLLRSLTTFRNREFARALNKILKNDIEDLPIPHKKFKEVKKTLSEIVSEGRAIATDADFIWILPTSESAFLNTLSKYFSKPEFIGYLQKIEERTYRTLSGNIIKFSYN
ncbi:MAG: hypothetical protein AABX55_00455 [Nanoarchaeota archaeon]